MSLCKKVGGRESNTYISVTDADALLEHGPDDVTDWKALSTEEKELRLRLAAQMIGYLPLRGYRMYRGQSLDFPRSGQGGGYRTIPLGVREAQAYLAYAVVHRALVNRPAPSEAVGSSVKSVSLGGMLSVTFAESGMGKGTFFDLITKSVSFPAYAALKPYTSQVRGRSVPTSDIEPVLSSTTTTESSTSSTTSTYSTTSTHP